MMARLFKLILLILLVGLTGCSRSAHRNALEADAAIHLTATMLSPIDIKLEWRNPAPNAAGHIVEFATEPNGEYIILRFCPPDETAFIHPRLMPKTTFYYRVRAFYGPATDPIEVSLPADLPDAVYAAVYAQPEDYHWAAPETLPDAVEVTKKSIRNPATMAEAAPADLKADLIRTTVSGFKLTWTDHASDEEGFLLEKVGVGGNPDLFVYAIVPPNINSFGWAFEPPQRKGSFRVRAFYYGKPSNLVNKTTGLDPENSR